MLSLTWMLHIYLRIICNNRLNETIDIIVIYFSINWCNICVASRCSKWNYSREIPFSMNKTLKRSTRITITGTLVLWCWLSFKGHRLLRSALPEIHGPLDRSKRQLKKDDRKWLKTRTLCQNIAYHQSYPSLHFDKDQNSLNLSYDSRQPVSILAKLFKFFNNDSLFMSHRSWLI